MTTQGEVKPFTLAGTSTKVDQCSQEPDQYKIKFYKAALCSDDPYKGSADPDFTSCIDILSSEKEVILQPNVDTNLLDGEDLVLPIGSYTYFTVIVHNHLNIKHNSSIFYRMVMLRIFLETPAEMEHGAGQKRQ